MTTTTMKTPLKRQILNNSSQEKTVELLQHSLFNLVDLALVLKQAHWNVIGKNFRSVHLQLDEVIATVREGSDEVAERIAALGLAADGSPRSSWRVALRRRPSSLVGSGNDSEHPSAVGRSLCDFPTR